MCFDAVIFSSLISAIQCPAVSCEASSAIFPVTSIDCFLRAWWQVLTFYIPAQWIHTWPVHDHYCVYRWLSTDIVWITMLEVFTVIFLFTDCFVQHYADQMELFNKSDSITRHRTTVCIKWERKEWHSPLNAVFICRTDLFFEIKAFVSVLGWELSSLIFQFEHMYLSLNEQNIICFYFLRWVMFRRKSKAMYLNPCAEYQHIYMTDDTLFYQSAIMTSRGLVNITLFSKIGRNWISWEIRPRAVTWYEMLQ